MNFDGPFDVKLLDHVIETMYAGNAQQVRRKCATFLFYFYLCIIMQTAIAQKILEQFQEHPQAWTRVDTILEYSQNQNTKFYALSILEKSIQFRWKNLPRQQCDGIKQVVPFAFFKVVH